MKPAFPVCYGAYSEKNEEKTRYNKPGWVSPENSTKKDELNRLCPKPWRYQEPGETYAMPKWGQFSRYSGGGFVVDLGYDSQTGLDIIETLQRHRWLDRQSRAVILELSIFNPPTNLIAVATYFYEIQPSGYSVPFEMIEIISLYFEETGLRQFYLVCILIFIIFVSLFVGRISYRVCELRSRFFKSFWNWVEIFEVVLSVLAVIMNIVRSAKAFSIVRKLNKNVYANFSFQVVIVWTEAENGVLGILAFVVTLKLLRLIRFNAHVTIFWRTLKTSTKLLPPFMAIFAIGFTAFLFFGKLIFGTGSEKYSSFLKAIYFQFQLVLGRVKARSIQELSDANRYFGRIFAASLLLSLTIVFMNFFISAINEAISEAKISVLPNELYDLVDEHSSDKGKNKKFFDVISKGLKQRTAREITPVSKDKGECKPTKWKKITGESVLTKPDFTGRKSIYSGINDTVVQLRNLQLTEDKTKLQLNKLHEKEKELFGRLDGIIQACCEEEEASLSLARKYCSSVNNTVLPNGQRQESTLSPYSVRGHFCKVEIQSFIVNLKAGYSKEV